MRSRKDRVQFATCPACMQVVPRPEANDPFPQGACQCGCVYVVDSSCHTLGEAMLEALKLACGGDEELGWNLGPEDYEEWQVLGYDERRHCVIGGAASYFSGMAALCFVRVNDGVLERLRGELGKEG